MYRRQLAGQARNLVDFNLGEKYLFGRVDRFFVPIQTRNPREAALFAGFKGFRSSAGAQQSYEALSFVVDAFEQMALQFEKCAAKGIIDTKDPFLSSLQVHKAHVSHESLYSDYLDIYLNTLKDLFDADKIKVRDFKEFMQHLVVYLERTLHTVPFTKPAYIKSRRCSIMTSGLAIEIADLDPVNDDEKINQFVNSKNWAFYVNACNDYGFMVDQFVPWRIVCDIDAPGMLKLSAKYYSPTTAAVLHNNYEHSHNKYFENFSSILLRLYNMVKYGSFYAYEECNGKVRRKMVIPLSYTLEELQAEFDEAYFLRVYCHLRFLEEESEFSINEREMLTNDCLRATEQVGLRASLIVFERILNKTFDYRGSASYIERYRRLVRDDISGY